MTPGRTTPARDDGGAVPDAPDPELAERREHPGSFDPGTETGYLRRGPRDHELPVEIGAEPFDPGPGHFDDRRARREAKRREKDERRRRERERERLAAAEREQAERRRAELAEAEARRREEHAGEEAEKARADAARRAQVRARQAGREREQAERESREQQLREQREARLRAERDKAERARAERERLKDAERARAEKAKAAAAPAATAPPANPKRAAPRGDGPSPALAPTGHGPRTHPSPLVERTGRRHGGDGPHPMLSGETSLRRPTALVGLALAAVTALAAGAGTLLGLPVPGLDSGEKGGIAISQGDAALAALGSGTPVGLTDGPYYPIAGKAGDGEADAKFGADRGGRKHEGQDLFAKPGTPLVAVRDGVVVDAGTTKSPYSGGRGNWVVIYSPFDDRSYVYLHLLEPPLVAKGEQVRAGQPLGQLGCTGSCYGPHLHFEIRRGEASFAAETKAIDPLPHLKQWQQVPVPES